MTHPSIPWRTLKKSEKIERLADVVDGLGVVTADLEKRIKALEELIEQVRV